MTMNRILALLFVGLAVAPLGSAQAQDPKSDLLKSVIARRTGDSLGRNVHWAESRDSVLARFANCRPHPSGVAACTLKDSIPTYSFEIRMIAADTAEVTVRRYHMMYESCPLRLPLDPPVVSYDVVWETWIIENGRWVTRQGRGITC
jgi:hypothetical protein